jgi:uncharacterized membrane protein
MTRALAHCLGCATTGRAVGCVWVCLRSACVKVVAVFCCVPLVKMCLCCLVYAVASGRWGFLFGWIWQGFQGWH